MKFQISKSHTTDARNSQKALRRFSLDTTDHPFLSAEGASRPAVERHTRGLPMSARRSCMIHAREPSPGPVTSHSPKRSGRFWGWGLAGLFAASQLWFTALPAQAQEPDFVRVQSNAAPENDASGSATFAAPTDSAFSFGPQITLPRFTYPTYPDEPPVVGGSGVKGRIQHIAGAQVGRTQAITNFDISPYVFVDNFYLFGEGRIVLGNNGKTGGSLGTGGRYFMPRLNAIVGASGWLDIDATRGPTFHQWSVGGEFFSEFLDIRANYYVPYGNTNQVTGQKFEAGSQKFIDRSEFDPALTTGTYLSFQRRIFSAAALRGFDTLFTIPMPGDFAQSINLETSGGFYGYDRQDGSIPLSYGWRVRFDADVFENLSHLFLEVNDDRLFRTNVAFGIDINYWGKLGHRPRLGHSQYNRLAQWVRRNRTVVALESSVLNAPERAINPATGNYYVINQVDSSNVGGSSGTLEDPYGSLQDAIDATGANSSDYIDFVQGNSSFSTPIVIDHDGLQVIGEQAVPDVLIPVQGLTSGVVLPTITPQPFAQAQITGVTGTAVTLNAANTRFAAFDILNTTGDAIATGALANGGTIENVNVTNVTSGNGVNFTNSTGTFQINDLNLTNIEGTAFRVSGGNAVVQFTGDSTIDNTANTFASHGYAVDIFNTNLGSAVNMSALTIKDTGGQGIRVAGAAPGQSFAQVTFGETTLTDTAVVTDTGAVYIANHSGTVSFTQNLTIDGISSAAPGDSFVVTNLQAGGSVLTSTGATTTISNRRGRGIYVTDTADTATGVTVPSVNFLGPVTVSGLGSGYTGTDSAVLFESYSGNLIFTKSLTVNGSLGDGVEVTSGSLAQGSGQGNFTAANVNITNVSGTVGVAGTSFNVHDIDKKLFAINVAGLTIDNRGIANSTDPIGTGISVQNMAGDVSFLTGVTTVNNSLKSTARGIDVENNSGLVRFGTTSVNDQIGGDYAVRVYQNSDAVNGVSFGSLTVNTTNAIGVSMIDNGKVSIGGGTVSATGARAIEVATVAATTKQQHNITLTAVNSSGADYGIYVDTSDGQFTVTGQTGILQSGGLINGGSVAGAYFNDTQRVDLRNMRITGGLQGVVAKNLLQQVNGISPGLFLDTMVINGEASEGIATTDVSNFLMQNSTISGNGVTNATEQIDMLSTISVFDVNNDTIDDSVVYNYTFQNNLIIDSLTTSIAATDMIFIHTATNIPNPVQLNLSFVNNGVPLSTTNTNTITANRSGGSAAIDVTWLGPVNANFDTNQFVLLNGAGQVGLDFTVDGVSNINYVNNSLNAAGVNDIGIRGVFAQSTTFNVSNNQQLDADGVPIVASGFAFSGDGSAGLDLSFLAANDNISINNNVFDFTGVSSQGIFFTRLSGNAGNTRVAIGGNSIYRPNTNNIIYLPISTGITFQAIQGTITLVNTGDNFVENGTFLPYYRDVFFANPAAALGTISVNGSLVP